MLVWTVELSHSILTSRETVPDSSMESVRRQWKSLWNTANRFNNTLANHRPFPLRPTECKPSVPSLCTGHCNSATRRGLVSSFTLVPCCASASRLSRTLCCRELLVWYGLYWTSLFILQLLPSIHHVKFGEDGGASSWTPPRGNVLGVEGTIGQRHWTFICGWRNYSVFSTNRFEPVLYDTVSGMECDTGTSIILWRFWFHAPKVTLLAVNSGRVL